MCHEFTGMHFFEPTRADSFLGGAFSPMRWLGALDKANTDDPPDPESIFPGHQSVTHHFTLYTSTYCTLYSAITGLRIIIPWNCTVIKLNLYSGKAIERAKERERDRGRERLGGRERERARARERKRVHGLERESDRARARERKKESEREQEGDRDSRKKEMKMEFEKEQSPE